ncbi:CitMHS family transporter [Lentibacillus amyloliquefaciens]|uniref:Citrate transporter n=1 Tax=Lentibacillus amyloliquefaciens TaxID=1472767 RepID=A0A0U4DUN4_9BACI|nr:CitMHS family transporter [Lentibacillus amyloliquefaciens]ALX49096.1 citrate transporter [Lentibacillus amyloliquefaciens]
MLSLIGFATILTIVILLIKGKVSPIIAMVLIPVLGAFAAGFGLSEIGEFFNQGMDSVIDVAIMFIFAILFFGIMQDAGLFDPLINKMIALSKGNIIAVSVATVLIAAVAQMDGSGASTFLITIPAMLPLYKRLKMSPYLLLLLIAGSAAIMNMTPWAGPLGRTASVLSMDVTELWYPLIPVQVIGMVLMIGLAVLLGYREKRKITEQFGNQAVLQESAAALEETPGELTEEDVKASFTESSLARPKLIWVNAIIAVGVVALLVSGIIPAGFAFMLGVSIILPINYPNMKDQTERIKAHASSALTMATIILAAGSFLGILTGTGMLNAIAEDVVSVMPETVGPYLHLFIGVLGVPFDLLLSTDAYYFALLPVVEQIAAGFGTATLSTAYAMIIGNIVGTFVSPLAPAVWLALGLSGLEMGRHIKYSLPWLWGLSIVLLIIAVFIGVV